MQLEQRLAMHIIVPIDLDTCRMWGNIRAAQQHKGHLIATQDPGLVFGNLENSQVAAGKSANTK